MHLRTSLAKAIVLSSSQPPKNRHPTLAEQAMKYSVQSRILVTRPAPARMIPPYPARMKKAESMYRPIVTMTASLIFVFFMFYFLSGMNVLVFITRFHSAQFFCVFFCFSIRGNDAFVFVLLMLIFFVSNKCPSKSVNFLILKSIRFSCEKVYTFEKIQTCKGFFDFRWC